MIRNPEIAGLFKLTAALMELHEENPFKIRMYSNAAQTIGYLKNELGRIPVEELETIDGIGKSIARSIGEINERGSFEYLDLLISRTPPGLLELISTKGIGPKKVKVLWEKLGVETVESLLEACEKNEVAKLKGFGPKSQELIARSLKFKKESRGKVRYPKAEQCALAIHHLLAESFPRSRFELAGDFRRKSEVIHEIIIICGTDERKEITTFLDQVDELKKDPKRCGPFSWRGRFTKTDLSFALLFTNREKLVNELLWHTGSEKHLALAAGNQTSLGRVVINQIFKTEEEVYTELGMQFVVPELREGGFEIDLAKENKLPKLIRIEDLKGALHNHSEYSDGKNSIREMALKCMEMGLEYLGMSDHSKSAYYAGGLDEYQLEKQWLEIDMLNDELKPFRIFKGIESDILNDGSLDYDEETLKNFDFVVASIHSGLNMTCRKATARLLRAIENPYTTILGHPTGRLLLVREGYPVDHKAVIKACAANGVIIEINANPWRLDLDWRWIYYAIGQGVLISINPDAHNTEGLEDIRYGVQMGRKGGLTAEMTFNAWPVEKVSEYFRGRKEK